MPTPDSTLSSLSAIRTKIRRLTRSPSTSQLTDAQIDDYINTFVLYDFPEFTVDKTLTFFLMPNIDKYGTNTINQYDPLYNFKNKYLSVKNPVYVAGSEISLSQSKEQFFGQFPLYNYDEVIAYGDGVTTAYTGTLSSIPILARTVMFASIDSDGNGIVIKDEPVVDPATGFITTTGVLVVPNTEVDVGIINYITGVYTFTFPVAPGNNKNVTAQAYKYTTGKPIAVLYEDSAFFFRPVPDKPYRVDADVYQRPTELLEASDTPELSQWWQYIAYGASKKVFEDRMDIESVESITPELLRQRSLVLQRLILQQSEERTPTIYSSSFFDKGNILN